MRQLAGLAADYDRFKAENAEIVAISVDDADRNRALAERLKLPFTVLSDAEHKVIGAYGIFDAQEQISKPAVFIIDGKGILRWSYVGKEKSDRPFNDALIAELKKIKG